MPNIRLIMGRGGLLVDSVGSDPALAATSGPWASPSLAVLASAWNSDTVSLLCQECLWVVVDLKRRYINWMNEQMNYHYQCPVFQILDPELFEHMHQNGDFTHFYFCYRWFLLDFKRGLLAKCLPFRVQNETTYILINNFWCSSLIANANHIE